MTNEIKPNWQDSLKQVNKGISSFIKQHASNLTTYAADNGTKTGIAAGCLQVMAASVIAIQTATTGSPEGAEALREGSNALMLGGLLAMGAGGVAETVAKVHLRGVDSLFEGAQDAKTPTAENPRSGHKRGATPVNDEVLANPAFQRAVKETFSGMQNDPEARAQITEMLKSTPGTRQVLMNAQMNIEKAREQYGTSMPTGHSKTDIQDDDRPEGPVFH